MSLEERTTRYTMRRTAELRGERTASWLDERTEKYIFRRLAEDRGEALPEERSDEHPYIKRRLAEIRTQGR